MKQLLKELKSRADFWRTTDDDPHGIATAVYVALMEVATAIEVSQKKRLNEGKEPLSKKTRNEPQDR